MEIIHTRTARSKTEIDFLPPFGEPEVVTTGSDALDVALFGVAASAGIAVLLNN